MHIFMISVLIIICLMIILSVSIGYIFSGMVVHPKVLPYETTYEKEREAGKLIEEEYNSWEKEQVTIKSPYGYDIFGIFFPLKDSKKAIIINHGITYSLYGSVKYMNMFRKRGFSILIYDNRFHGRSGGKNTTFGKYEKYDLKACTDWVLKRCGEDTKVGIHGESLGAGIALSNAAIDDRLSFVIADCPYSDLVELLKYRIRIEYKLPSFPFINLASLSAKLTTGFSFSEASPIRNMDKIKTPIFFIHGKDDDYIPTQMSVDMFNKKTCKKKLYIAPAAGHAQAYWNNKEEYDQKIGEFFDEIELY